jgi:competence protein ComEC
MLSNMAVLASLSFAAGIALVQTFAVLPVMATLVLYMAVAAVATALACWMTRLRKSGSVWKIACIAVGAALTGFTWAAVCAHDRLRDRLPAQWEGRNIALIGTVADLPTASVRGTRFLFVVERVLPQDGARPHVPARLSLSWYAGRNGASTVPPIAPGQRWQFTVRLTRPHGNANPDGFDYELRLLERGIGATGYVRTGAGTSMPARLLDAFVITPSHVLERVRGYLRQKILMALQSEPVEVGKTGPEENTSPAKNAGHARQTQQTRQAPHAGVIVALVIGEQRAIEKTDWDVFRRTGVNHLVAISGLHIMMVAGLFGRLTGALWRRSFWLPGSFPLALPLVFPAQKVAMLAAVFAAVVYVALAGFGIPAQRALTMLSVIALALWLGRISSPSQVLCIALAVVLLLDPWALLWPGFHLSFAAVGIILYAGVGRTGLRSPQPVHAADSLTLTAPRRGWRSRLTHGFIHGLIQKLLPGMMSGARTQWAVSLGLLPLTMLLFAQYSLISPLANALAIPIVTLFVVPLALLGAVLPAPLAGFFLNAAHGFFSVVFYWLELLSTLPVAVWRAPLPGWQMFLMALAGTLLILAPRGWPLRWVGFFGWLPLLLNTPAHPAAGVFWVTAFDIGQGMALLVETAQHRLVYDSGPPYGPDTDAGERIILPYLHARGVDRLDALVISHSDSDHAGGALTLLHAMPVATVYSSLPRRHRIVEAALRHQRCVGGLHWQWDGVTFDILYPSPANYSDQKLSANAHSCVLKISSGAQSILLPGDIGVIQERQLLTDYGATDLHATVLLAPHHGSKTSSSGAFLRAVDPRLAIFQVGYRNRFHHPQVMVYKRYQELGIERLRTDEKGAITLQFGEGMQYQAYRQQHARYWHPTTEPNN